MPNYQSLLIFCLLGMLPIGVTAQSYGPYGDFNTKEGYRALFSNTTGTSNSAFGYRVLYFNTTGFSNTAIGRSALTVNTKGNSNTAVGRSSLFSNTTGNRNTGLGRTALSSNTTGSSNVAVGTSALYSNTDGSNLVAVGDSAMYNNGWGATGNVAVGSKAMYANTHGFSVTALGSNALYSNTDRSWLVAIGDSALYHNGIGATDPVHATSNVALGSSALFENTVGRANTAIGQRAMYLNTTGFANSAIGAATLYANTTGSYNTANGYRTLYFNTTGSSNTAHGYRALYFNTTGRSNTANGRTALNSNTTGSNNTATGHSANSVGTTYSNTTGLGFNADCSASNQVRVGNNASTSIGGYQNWTNVSDQRFKQNVQENVKGLSFINALRPVTYTLDQVAIENFFTQHYNEVDTSTWASKYDASTQVRTGFLAQEVETAAQSIGYDFSGIDAPKNEDDFYGLRYAEFTVPLVKAVQELSAENEVLKEENATLAGELNEIKAQMALVSDFMTEYRGQKEAMSTLQEEINALKTDIQYCCTKHDAHLHLQNSDRAYIEQNSPNPFNGYTVIRYFLPEQSGEASLRVLSNDGRIINTVQLQAKGLSSVQLSTTDLAAGNYKYALVIDGTVVDTKSMMVVKH